MTSQSSLNIKDEQLSPPARQQMLAVRASRTASRAAPRSGIPAKRLKPESEDHQASTPETKKKLQSAVLDRRKANGCPGIPSDLFEEPTVCELTQDDLKKRERRKEQNRNAAKKCRAKKKEQQSKAEKKTAQYAECNKKMQHIIYSMCYNLSALVACFSEHLNCGDCNVSVDKIEEHKQFIYETETFLDSCSKFCIPEEGKKAQASPATSNIDQDSSQLSSISDNCASNCVLMRCPVVDQSWHQLSFFNDSADNDSKLMNTNVPSLSELGNLPSSELADINPDILFTTFSNVETDTSLTGSLNDPKTEFTEIGPHVSISQEFHDLYLPTLTEGGLTHGRASTDDSTCLKVEKTGGFQEKDYLSIFDVSGDHHLKNRVLTCTEFRETETSDFCTSPNLVQQTLTGVKSCPSLMTSVTIQRDIGHRYLRQGNRQFIGQQSQVNADINNNGHKQSPVAQTEENYSLCVDYPSIRTNMSQNYSILSPGVKPVYFTFENDQSSPEETGPSGDEPISPFYTQGGDRRM